ncbi:hypothetical protein PAXINDRAFT_69068 [Paxillus involutus ATCC 200175]|nr:hypothetical protein PAXINDRAFT_69068 [Paxillus involutus ATCC 200175]
MSLGCQGHRSNPTAPSTKGSIFSAIGSAINGVISAIARAIMAIVGGITMVIVTIFDVIADILCCRCCSHTTRRSVGRGRWGRRSVL